MKKSKLKTILIFFIFLFFFSSLFPFKTVCKNDNFLNHFDHFRLIEITNGNVFINGEKSELKAINFNGVWHLPVGIFGASFGSKILLNYKDSSVNGDSSLKIPFYEVALKNLKLEFEEDASFFFLNGIKIYLLSGKIRKDDLLKTFYFPLREVFESIGAQVLYDHLSKKISIGYSTLWQENPKLKQKQLKFLNNSKVINLSKISTLKVKEKVVALTIDDNWSPEYTAKTLDVLKKCNAKATFFILAVASKNHLSLVKRMAEEGHDLGNHSFSHPDAKKVSNKFFAEQIQATERLVNSIGLTTKPYYRFPYLSYKSEHLKIIKDLGYFYVGGAMTIQDSKKKINIEKSVNYILKNIEPGDIIIGHSNYQESFEIIEVLLDKLTKEGYQFITLTDLTLKGVDP